jgi:hypothetical protein
MQDRASEGGDDVSLRKHGTGEILPDEEDLQKEASTEEWTEEDQAALDEENEK